MKEYLIFAECGGENGNPLSQYGHYYICKGRTEEDALNEWFSKVEDRMVELYKTDMYKSYNYNRSNPNFTNRDGVWYESGYKIQMVHLKANEGYSKWKELKWV